MPSGPKPLKLNHDASIEDKHGVRYKYIHGQKVPVKATKESRAQRPARARPPPQAVTPAGRAPPRVQPTPARTETLPLPAIHSAAVSPAKLSAEEATPPPKPSPPVTPTTPSGRITTITTTRYHVRAGRCPPRLDTPAGRRKARAQNQAAEARARRQQQQQQPPPISRQLSSENVQCPAQSLLGGGGGGEEEEEDEECVGAIVAARQQSQQNNLRLDVGDVSPSEEGIPLPEVTVRRRGPLAGEGSSANSTHKHTSHVSAQDQLKRNQRAAAAAAAPTPSNTLLDVLVDALDECCDLNAITYSEWYGAAKSAGQVFRNSPGPNNEVFFDPRTNRVANSSSGPWYPLENTRGGPPLHFRWGKLSHANAREVHMSPTWHFVNPTSQNARAFESLFVDSTGSQKVTKSIRRLLRDLFPKNSDGVIDSMASYIHNHKKFRHGTKQKAQRAPADGWELEADAVMVSLDLDGDGELDTVEMVALARQLGTTVDAILEEFDTNGDQVLQKDEWMQLYSSSIAPAEPESPTSARSRYQRKHQQRVLEMAPSSRPGGRHAFNEREMRQRMQFQGMPATHR